MAHGSEWHSSFLYTWHPCRFYQLQASQPLTVQKYPISFPNQGRLDKRRHSTGKHRSIQPTFHHEFRPHHSSRTPTHKRQWGCLSVLLFKTHTKQINAPRRLGRMAESRVGTTGSMLLPIHVWHAYDSEGSQQRIPPCLVLHNKRFGWSKETLLHIWWIYTWWESLST